MEIRLEITSDTGEKKTFIYPDVQGFLYDELANDKESSRPAMGWWHNLIPDRLLHHSISRTTRITFRHDDYLEVLLGQEKEKPMTYTNNIHKFDIQGRFMYLYDALTVALKNPFASENSTDELKVAGWIVDERATEDGFVDRLLLLKDISKESEHRFMAPMGSFDLDSLIGTWIKQAHIHDEPNTDGAVELGFRMYNDNWEQVEGFPNAIVAIEPAWLVFGK